MSIIEKLITNKIFSNASWIIACRIMQAVCSLIVTMVASRFLGPSKYGLISYAASICTFFLPIMQLGLPSIQVQELINKDGEEGTIIGSSLIMSFLSSLFCVIGIYAFTSIINRGEVMTVIVCVLYSFTLVFQSLEIIQFWFQAHYHFKYVSIVSLVAFIAISIYKIYLLAAGKNIYWYTISYLLDHLIIAVSLLSFYYKIQGPPLKINKETCICLLNRSKYYIISNLMIVIFAQTDRIMLKNMAGNEITGYYSAAFTLANMVNFLYEAIIDSYRPFIFQSYKVSLESFNNSLKNLYCIIVYATLLICTGITIFAPLGVYIVYGRGFLHAVNILRIVVWYAPFAYIGTIRNIWMLAKNMQHLLWSINFLGAIANIVINLLLIPKLGAIGAAIASLLTQIFTNVILSIIIPELRAGAILLMESLNPKRLFFIYKKLYYK